MKTLHIRKFNYRHLVGIVILITSLLFAIFCVPWVFQRTLEMFVNLLQSLKFYFLTLVWIDTVPPSGIGNVSGVDHKIAFPINWEEFKISFVKFWETFFNGDNFSAWVSKFGEVMLIVLTVLQFVLILGLLIKLLLSRSLETTNNDYGKDSKPLKAFKRIEKLFVPVKKWFKDLSLFFKTTKVPYKKLFIVIWLYNLNVYTIIGEALAFLFFFVSSLDFSTFFTQIYKLIFDISLMLKALPWCVWVMLVIMFLRKRRIKKGLKKLNHMQAQNCGFVKSLGVATLITGPLAISGLAVTFPFMNLGAAFGAMVGVGASTLISVKLGQRDYTTAQVVLGNVITLNTIIGVVYTIVCLMFLDPILYFFGASADTIVYARDFMEVILLGNIFTHMYLGLNAVLRASGHPQKAMYATINTVIINTILAPIFIYGFDWGIRGAAIATVIAQIVSLIWQFKILTNKNELLHLRRGIYHLQSKIVRNMIAIGLSPFCMNVASCFIVIFINQGLKEYDGDLAIGAYGIVNRLVFICVMIVMGITQGMQPIAGYNYGAQQYHRVNEVLKLAIWGATAVTTFTFLVGELVPELTVSIFTTDEGLISRAAEGFRISVLLFPIVGFQMVTSNFFQSIGMANKAIFLSLTRQLLFLLPCLIVLPRFMGAAGIWWSMPISDLIASIVAAVLLYKQFQAFKNAEITNQKL